MASSENQSAIETWRRRVESHHAQSRAVMDEAALSGDFWRSLAPSFRADPRRTDDEALNIISELAESCDSLLDVGGGAGRFAVALALAGKAATVVDPSESMLEQLREAADEAGATDNVTAVFADWEVADANPADAVLCSHVVYGVAEIEPFVRKLIAHARRRVIMLSFVDSPQASVAPLWEPVHGARRVNLPALPELMGVLWEMGVYPNVRMLTPNPPQTFESEDAALEELARRLFVGESADARARLEAAASDFLERTADGNLRIIGAKPSRQGAIWWDADGGAQASGLGD